MAPTGGESTGLPELVAVVLRRAQAAEQRAIGAERRPAFQLTRSLLGGARRAGYPPGVLAATLGVSVASLRARAGVDGVVSGPAVIALAGLDPGVLEAWTTAQRIRPVGSGPDHYLASDLVAVLGSAEVDAS